MVLGEHQPQLVGYERTGGVAVVSFNSGPANAWSLELVTAFDEVLDRALGDQISVMVVASAIPGFFVAGADIKLMESGDPGIFDDYLGRLRAVIERVAKAPFLSIAAVGGHALGGGLELAMACSLRIAGPEAHLGVPEIKLGLVPGAGGTQRLPRLVGRALAVDLITTGRSMDSQEALASGLVDRVSDDPTGDGEEWAHELAQGPVAALLESIRCVDASAGDPADGMEYERAAVQRLFRTTDGQEGLRAFIEKRRPVFGNPTRAE